MSGIIEELTEDIIRLHNAPILQEISEKTNKRNAVQAKYDTLEDFKSKMQTQQSYFTGVSNDKQSKINDLNNLRKDCNACEIYITGMDASFGDMVNNRIPNFLFTPFFNKINSQLSIYNSEIISLQSRINYLEGCLW